MKRKAVSGIMSTLLLIGMLTLAFVIQLVKSDWTWTETIYIRTDGSVDPDTAPISSIDNVTYRLTDSIVGDVPVGSSAIVVERDNIVVDGAGYFLQQTRYVYSFGIDLTVRNNVTIKDMEIRAFWHGIWLFSSSNNIISGNNITNNGVGVYLRDSSNDNIICGNSIENNDVGVALVDSSYNTIFGNNITNNMWLGGVHLDESSNNKIYRNNFINNPTQAYVIESYDNSWDDGYPSGGNYWSDYPGVDLYGGPSQDLPGSDGIGDTSYIIDVDNMDRYPLWNPHGSSPPTFTITVSTTPGGTTSPPPEAYSHNSGTAKAITATPDTDHRLHHWELNGVNVGSANPISVTMDRNHILHAVFVYSPPPPPPPPPRTLYVSPYHQDIVLGETFTVDVMLSEVEDLVGYEFKLFYDTNVLTAIDLAPHIGTTREPGFFFPEYIIWMNQINDDPWGNGTGYVFLAATMRFFGAPIGVDGSGKLATIEFIADEEGSSMLTFPEHLLGNSSAMRIPHTVADGSVTVIPPPAIPATVDIEPDTLNLKSKGKWITGYIELPEGYNVSDIDVNSILLNRTVPVDAEASITVGDYDFDNIPDLMVKFDRATVVSYISNNIQTIDRPSHVTLTVSCNFADGTPFRDSDTIRVVIHMRGPYFTI